jgi:DNA-binding response OmpR family regulator
VSLRENQRTELASPMFLQELFASVRAHFRRSTQQRTDEQGAEMARRLQDLLDVRKRTQIETFSTKARTEKDPGHANRHKPGT